MTKSQKLSLRMSEVRQRLNEIGAMPDADRTDEVRTEQDGLVTEFRNLEGDWRAAVILEDKEAQDAETRAAADGTDAERRRLAERVTLGAYLSAIGGGKDVAADSPEAELRSAYDCAPSSEGGVRVPWAALLPRGADRLRGVEERADAVTDLASGNTGPLSQMAILSRLFAKSAMELLGVRLDSVMSGRTEWPIISAGVTPAQSAESAQVDSAEATFAVHTLKPKRLEAAYRYSANLAHQLGEGELEGALRRDLMAALRDRMDHSVINGNGTDPNVEGVLGALATPDNPSDESTFADYIGVAAEGVDGIHATMESEVSVLMGVDSYRHMTKQIQSGTDRAASEVLARRARMVMASSNMPAKTSANNQTAILHAGGDAMRGDSVAAVWGGGPEILRDPYTHHSTAEIRLTICAFWDAKMVVRAGAYKAVRFKLA